MTRMNFRQSLPLCFTLLSLAGFTANASTVVFQADGLRHGAVEGTNFVLTADNGIKLYGSSQEWKKDASTGIIYNAVGSGAFPLRIEASPETSGKYVKTLFIVTTNAPAIRLFETIVASKERFRMAGKEANDLFNDQAIPDTGKFTAATWRTDLEHEKPLLAGRFQLLEVEFLEMQPLDSMQFLSEGNSTTWLRAFRGGMLEMIAIGGAENDNAPVPEPVREAIAHYVRLRHGLTHLHVMSTPKGRAMGSVMGINYAGVFGTVYSVR